MKNRKKAMKRTMLFIHANTYFTGLLPVAISIKKSGRYEPRFLFCGTYPTLPNELDRCRQEGLSFHANSSVAYNTAKKLLRKMPAFILSSLRYSKIIISRIVFNNIMIQTLLLYNRIKLFRQLINEQDISLVIMPADNRYDQAAIVKAAHNEKVPVVVIPQFMASALEWAEFVWEKREYSARSWANRFACSLFPRWGYVHKGRRLIALPANQVFAREWLGIAPPLPWILHSGHADALAVESEAVRDYCIAEGLPPEKIKVTGSSTHDIISAIISKLADKRLELYADLSLPDDRPMILSALPPDSLYMGRPQCEFKKYDDLIEFWCRSLAAIKSFNIVICLHPSETVQKMKYIERYGVKIAKKPTYELIPLCDIFVASISSTIQWAIACGKPVVNYDVYRYRYTDYVNVEGVISIEDKSDYANTLQRLTSDAEYRAEMTARQSVHANRWGRLDGGAGDRLMHLFDDLIDHYDNRNEGGGNLEDGSAS
ncbi:MAG: glycosyltransferase [Thermoplasmata archaeon]|nr:glycosyltransferase [Thermoplasmata archaeon]